MATSRRLEADRSYLTMVTCGISYVVNKDVLCFRSKKKD